MYENKAFVNAEQAPVLSVGTVDQNLPRGRHVSKLKVRVFLLLPGGVDNCVKLWNARSICNPDDEEEEGSDAK